MVCCDVTSTRPPRQVDSAWSWLVCACASVSNGLVHSVVLCFGVLLPVLMDEFGDTRDKTALVGSLTFGVALFTCVISRRVIDWMGFKCAHALGTLTCAVSMVVSSWATSTMYLYLSYGIMYGLGMSVVLTSCFLVVAKYFKRHRCFAVGFVSTGSGAAVFAMAPSLQALIDSVGWRNAYRALSTLFLLTCLFSMSFDPNVEDAVPSGEPDNSTTDRPVGRRNWMDLSVCVIPSYIASVWSMSLITFGLVSLPIHLVRHCEELGFSAQQASYLFLGVGLSSTVSRLVTGKICDSSWANPRYINQLSGLCGGTITLLMSIGHSYIVLVVLTLIYGIADGTYNTSYNAAMLYSVRPEQRSYAFAYANVAISLFLTAGPALTGLVADKLSYAYAFYMCGGVTLLGSAIPLVICFVKDKPLSSRISLPSRTELLVKDSDSRLEVTEWIFVL